MPAQTRLAQLIAKEEGYGIRGAIPTVDNNPGDLRHSPHSSHEGEGPDDIGIIPNMNDGWADLERQLQLYAQRGMTLAEMVSEYAPVKDGNDPNSYLAFVCNGLGLLPTATVEQALTIPAVQS